MKHSSHFKILIEDVDFKNKSENTERLFFTAAAARNVSDSINFSIFAFHWEIVLYIYFSLAHSFENTDHSFKSKFTANITDRYI